MFLAPEPGRGLLMVLCGTSGAMVSLMPVRARLTALMNSPSAACVILSIWHCLPAASSPRRGIDSGRFDLDRLENPRGPTLESLAGLSSTPAKARQTEICRPSRFSAGPFGKRTGGRCGWMGRDDADYAAAIWLRCTVSSTCRLFSRVSVAWIWKLIGG
jgi:hypothetical protein